MKEPLTASRRKFLTWLGMAAGGLFGTGIVRWHKNGSESATPDTGTGETTLKLHGYHWHIYSQQHKRGEQPDRGDQLLTYGELRDRVDGPKRGEFYSSGLHMGFPFGGGPYAASSVEVHSFNLDEGTILGMGTSKPGRSDENIYAVLGGTGQYAGASGTYTARQHPAEQGGDGTAEFQFRLSQVT